MTFSYSGDPASSPKDAVRFLTGDTDPTETLLTDEEVNWLLVAWSAKQSTWYTASMAAKSIAAKFAREITTSSDSQTVNADALQQKYLDLANQLMQQHRDMLAGGGVDVGGIDTWRFPDLTVSPSAFGTQMHDSYEAGPQDLGDIGAAGWDPLSQSWYYGYGR